MTSPMIFSWAVRSIAPSPCAAVCRKQTALASLLIGQALGVRHAQAAASGRTPAGSGIGALAESLNSTVMKIISASPVF